MTTPQLEHDISGCLGALALFVDCAGEAEETVACLPVTAGFRLFG